MRKGVWATVALAAPILAAALLGVNQLLGVSILVREWWLVPLSSSAASTLTLAVASASRHATENGKSITLLTGAYLIPGPSTALLNLPSLLSMGAPPGWARCAMPILLLGSAWIYYHATEGSEDVSGAKQRSLDWTFIPQAAD